METEEQKFSDRRMKAFVNDGEAANTAGDPKVFDNEIIAGHHKMPGTHSDKIAWEGQRCC